MLLEKGELLLKTVKMPEIKEEIETAMACQIYLIILTS
jgi:hypothetical protein